MSYNMTDQQIEISQQAEIDQQDESKAQQQQEEQMQNVCQNFMLFLQVIHLETKGKLRSQKKKMQKNKKITKKKSSIKQKKKIRSKSETQQTIRQESQQVKVQQENNFQKEFDNLIKKGMSVSEIHHLIDLLQKQEHEKIIEELRLKYPTLLDSYIKELKQQCFTTYLQQHGLPQGQMPPNCLHINICYYIWEKQGKAQIDPTLSGRERKSQQMQNKLLEDQQINTNQFLKFLIIKKRILKIRAIKNYKVLIYFFANQFFMEEYPKLEQLQEFEKFSFNKDGQQSQDNQSTSKQFQFDNSNYEGHKRYRFNSFENQNQLNERDMTILQILMQNEHSNTIEDFQVKKRRKSSYYETDINDNLLDFSQKRKQSFPRYEEKETQQISNDQLFNSQQGSHKELKIKKQTITNRQQQNTKESVNPISTEKAKLNAKMIKVAAFWKSQTFFIPNVFRMVKPVQDSQEYVFEIQDLSKKEVLIQSNGQKIKEMQ